MESIDRTAVAPSKSRLARTFAKVLHIRAVTGIAPDDGIHKIKLQDKIDRVNDDNEKLQKKLAMDAFIAKLFASISTVKAAYAHMQFAEAPYDGDGIQLADEVIVSELKFLSELKQCYLKNQLDDCSPEVTFQVAELKEQKSIVKTYEIMGQKMDFELKLKDSELTFVREKLEEANRDNKLLEKRLNASGLLSVPGHLQLSGLNPNHFISVLHQTTKSLRNFVRLMINEMELGGWDLDAAVRAIAPNVPHWSAHHKHFAFESFVCSKMFDGFNYPNFSPSTEVLEKTKQRRIFFERFTELKSAKSSEYLLQNPKSRFAKFCSKKYLQLVHPKMELSLYGNLNQRHLVSSGECPDTAFFAMFSEMAKRIWLLHCLAFSFDPEASIFQVCQNCRFSEVYMETVNEEVFFSSHGTAETEPVVAFTVIPGFKIAKTVIQAQVFLT